MKISIPVYVAIDGRGQENLFRNNEASFIDEAYNTLSHFDIDKNPIKKSNQNKLEYGVESFFCREELISGIRCIVVKLTSFEKGLTSRYILKQGGAKEQLDNVDISGVGDINILLFPTDSFNQHRLYTWQVLICNDPRNNQIRVLSIIKLFLKKTLGIKLINIKLKSMYEEIQDKLMNVKLIASTTIGSGNDENIAIRSKSIMFNEKSSKMIQWEGINFEELQLIQKYEFFDIHTFKRRIKVDVNEYQYLYEYESISDLQNDFNSIVEKHYNVEFEVSDNFDFLDEDVNSLYMETLMKYEDNRVNCS